MVLLLGLSSVYWVLEPFSLTQSQLSWLLVGERAAQGYLPFYELIDDTAPLSVAVFATLNSLFGKNLLAYEIFGRLLILAQAIYWNLTLIRYRVFDETSYLPAILVVVLFHFSFDLLSLSPALMGSTFLLLALARLISLTVLQKETSESTLLIGLYAGLAVGFHSVYLIFLPYLIFTGIVISGFSFRELLLSLAGFFLPLLLIATYYFWNNGLWSLIEVWPLGFLTPRIPYQSLLSWGMYASFPLLLGVLGYVFCAVLKGSTINQQKQRQLLIVWLVLSSFQLFLIKDQAAYQLAALIPSLSYLITQFFHFAKRPALANLLFMVFIFGFPVGSIWYWQHYFQSNPSYLVQKATPNSSSGMMILQNDLSPLLGNRLDGPFLNYEMTRLFLEKEKNYGQKARLFVLLETQKSKKILDPNGEFERVLEQFPVLSDDYRKTKPGVFELK